MNFRQAFKRAIKKEVAEFDHPRRRRLDEALKPVDERLHAWGSWSKAGRHGPEGWPESLIGRVIEDSPEGVAFVLTSDTVSPPKIEMNKEIEEVEKVLCKLSGIRLKVLKIAYMHMPHQPPDVQRRRLNMSRHKWNSVLRETRLLVAMGLGMEV